MKVTEGCLLAYRDWQVSHAIPLGNANNHVAYLRDFLAKTWHPSPYIAERLRGWFEEWLLTSTAEPFQAECNQMIEKLKKYG